MWNQTEKAGRKKGRKKKFLGFFSSISSLVVSLFFSLEKLLTLARQNEKEIDARKSNYDDGAASER